MRSADFVLIPVKPSPVDLDALPPVIEACTKQQRDYCLMLSMYVKGWKLNPSIVDQIERAYPGRLLDPALSSKREDDALVFSLKPAYVASIARGLAGAEHSDKAPAKFCASEVDRLWSAVRSQAVAAVAERAKRSVL